MPHTDAIVVMTTLASTDEAVKLVRALLERRLIACGTVLPGGRSLYRWEGKIADEQEVVVLLKTRSARLDTLQVAFGELHPYKVPELLALPVTAAELRSTWSGSTARRLSHSPDPHMKEMNRSMTHPNPRSRVDGAGSGRQLRRATTARRSGASALSKADERAP